MESLEMAKLVYESQMHTTRCDTVSHQTTRKQQQQSLGEAHPYSMRRVRSHMNGVYCGCIKNHNICTMHLLVSIACSATSGSL